MTENQIVLTSQSTNWEGHPSFQNILMKFKEVFFSTIVYTPLIDNFNYTIHFEMINLK